MSNVLHAHSPTRHGDKTSLVFGKIKERIHGRLQRPDFGNDGEEQQLIATIVSWVGGAFVRKHGVTVCEELYLEHADDANRLQARLVYLWKARNLQSEDVTH